MPAPTPNGRAAPDPLPDAAPRPEAAPPEPADPALALFETLERMGAVPPRDSEDPMARALRQMIEASAAPPRRQSSQAAGAASHRLREENRRLRAQCDLLAAATGACPHCWGADRGCPDCRGRGRAGHVLPDEACFAHYVLPALRRVLGALPKMPSTHPTSTQGD